MMNQVYFNFKMRMSEKDWVLLSDVMVHQNRFYTSKAQRDWFFNQVNRFCREVALPFIEKNKEPSGRVEKNILIEEATVQESECIATLRKFLEAITDHPYTASPKEWFSGELSRFCREIALPFIESCKNDPTVSVEKVVCIPVIPFDESNNIAIVREFAFLKQKTVTEIINKYIVDRRILQEERRRMQEPPAKED